MSANGNKPLGDNKEEFASEFTKRIVDHPRIAYHLDKRCLPGGVLILMVIDELLVSQKALGETKFRNYLESRATRAGPVLPGREDSVQVYRLNEAPGDKEKPDVADAVWKGRELLAPELASHVAPNHVLIPASNYHTCPWGPPAEPDHEAADLGYATGAVRVTVIDSGFVTGGPIDRRLQSARFGSWFTHNAAGGHGWMPEAETLPGKNPVDQNGDHKLDALVGHANFVAGVVAQSCPDATIDIVSHNGSFVESDSGQIPDTPFPTEASVARSLWETLDDHDSWSDVINIGFAFPTLPFEESDPAVDGPPSFLFASILDEFADARDFWIVAPAGNQNCVVPQYPAALWTDYPTRVISVGSIERDCDHRSVFSNYGPWVRCCTQGEDVVSTFVSWHGPTEEVDPNPPPAAMAVANPVETFKGWARWQGTSFAAPKVAGALARRKADGMSLSDAWDDLTFGRPSPPNLEMGVCLDGLPPV